MTENITKTSRRGFISAMAGSAAFGTAALSGEENAQATPAPRRRPNILYVFDDMHRASAMGCDGDPNVRTPNFDAFAKEGAMLKTAMSSTPVCCPHRASLLSGQYGHHHGMVSNGVDFLPQGPCIAETFRDAGYTTGYSGKWHLAYPVEGSKTRRFGFPNVPTSQGSIAYKGAGGHYVRLKHPDGSLDDEKIYRPTLWANETIDFIKKESKSEKPWLFFLSWIAPHVPYAAPAEYKDHYKGRLELLPNVPAGAPEEFARKALPDYYGMIESLDAEFGRILQALDKTGAADDTVVVFSSDHGDMIGCNGYKVKRWPHDNSARVPFLIRYPRAIDPGQILKQPFDTPDVYPTLAGLADVKTPGGLDGLDYSPLLTGESAKAPRDYAFMQMMYAYVPWPGWRALRTEQHMYARTAQGPWVLFDMENDPYELKNLAEERSAQPLVKEMDRRLAQIMKETGDRWDYKATTGDLKNWLPGGPKQRAQNLGVDWPGKAVGDKAPKTGGKQKDK